MKLLKSIVILSTVCCANLAYADLGFNKSADLDDQLVFINIGPSESSSWVHPAALGSPAIGVSVKSNGLRVAFKGLLNSLFYTMPTDKHDIYDSSLVRRPGTHTNIGAYRFSKLDNDEIYYGEWTYQSEDVDYRNVYYTGKNTTTNMPTEGVAIYTTQGISYNSHQAGPVTGQLTADFAKNTLQGDLANNELSLNIDAIIIDSSNQFSGNTIMTHNNNNYIGNSEGHFFNDQADALAGIATFKNNSQYDTSFAGKKQD
ncbi:Slam-dependent surface lipoprotein [Moellerella wisconsensis]|uniref:Slam-dependent surface lipoprotein n=1 Tax=Moellerella wisconsensis TaxID=158849 RepID=UPI00307661EF